MKNLKDFLAKSLLINHLKISGMAFNTATLYEIAESIARSPLLMSVHMSDNEVYRDYAMMNDILNLFNMGETDLHEVNRSQNPLH